MRADRLLSIVLLLQTNHRLTARDLAQRLEVSERTVHRDMEALSGAGIPVVAERGTGGGWSLIGEYRTTLTGLTEAEIQSLFVSKPSKLLADLRLDQAAEQALMKLSAALPERHREGVERARQRIHIDSRGWSQPVENVPLLPLIQDAVWLAQKLRFSYDRAPDCQPAQRLVDPLGLVAKGQAWYLVASVSGTLRTYRVSRIITAEILNEPVTVPPDFNLVAYWEQSTNRFKSHLSNFTATFRVAPEVFPRLRLAGRFARVNEPTDTDRNGWFTVSVGFDVEEMACEWALGFGALIEVLSPETLRAKVISAAKGVVDFYAKRSACARAG